MNLPVTKTFAKLDVHLFQLNVPIELRQIILQYYGYDLDPNNLTNEEILYVSSKFDSNNIILKSANQDVFLVVKLSEIPTKAMILRYLCDDIYYVAVGNGTRGYYNCVFYQTTNYLCVKRPLYFTVDINLLEKVLLMLNMVDERLIIVTYRVSVI
jgi:hypothetical protein